MSDFVEECRREWKRLRVPSGIADQMADDLAADLREAAAEGTFPEEVLGDGAADPRAFAAAWAHERGLVEPRWSDRFRRRHSLLLVLAFVGLPVVGVTLGFVLASARERQGQRAGTPVPAATTRAPTVVRYVPGGLIGTSIAGARLLPSGVRLTGGHPRLHVHGRPRALRATVANTGELPVDSVTLVVQVGRTVLSQTVRALKPNDRRQVTVPLPSSLPGRVTIRVFTRPVRGEMNTANNSMTWKLRIET